jgi:hypothetical protein
LNGLPKAKDVKFEIYIISVDAMLDSGLPDEEEHRKVGTKKIYAERYPLTTIDEGEELWRSFIRVLMAVIIPKRKLNKRFGSGWPISRLLMQCR